MDKTLLWKKILSEVKSQAAGDSYKTWFSQAEIRQITQDKIIIVAQSAFSVDNMRNRHLAEIQKIVSSELGITQIEFIVDGMVKQKESGPEETPQEEFFQPKIVTAPQSISPKFTMENYVVGLTNNVAYAAAQAVAQNPGTSYNPLYIYGGTGVGKTHLMLGIGNAILKKNPQAKVIYCPSEKFTNDYVAAIQTRKMHEFRSRYRLADVLLVDDIQFFTGRDSTQEEFFHTFNELQTKGSQMVFTSDRAPHEIAKLEDRLKSRFAGGLMIDIQAPDFDTRIAILKAKCNEWGTVMPEDALKLIASSSQLNIRELEGKLMQVIQTMKARNLELNLENISGYINKDVVKPNLTYKEVLDKVCRFFNLNLKDISGPKRQKGLVLPRHIAMYLLSEELGITVQKIGQILGGRDHTTVMHGRDRIKNELGRDESMRKLLQELSTT